ncbi:MAG: ABC transporter permease [Spirochaetia bacterium]|nr:ABC transporter permease [Spirochaetia bacterium]
MKFIIILALKNLTRYKRRTIITSSAIAIGLMMFILVDSLLMGAEEESVRNLKWYETSSMRIMHEDYWEDRLMKPLNFSIENPEAIIEKLASEGIAATKRTTFSADMILNNIDFKEEGNISVVVNAIDPLTDNNVFRFEGTLLEGRYISPGTNEINIGSWFAEDIGAKIGSYITLVTRGNGGFYEAMDLEIVGIINCPNPNVNRTLLMMPFDTASEYLAFENTATEINIALKESATIDKEIVQIKEILNLDSTSYTIMDYKELAHDFVATIEAERGSSGVFLFLVFIIAAVGISNTMLMAMYERMREIGMMRALGMKDSSIQLLFIFEAGGIGLLGAIIGILLGSITNYFLVKYGINVDFMIRDMDVGYRISAVMRGMWSIKTILTSLFSGIVLSMIVAYIPTRRALKVDIPSALAHQ